MVISAFRKIELSMEEHPRPSENGLGFEQGADIAAKKIYLSLPEIELSLSRL
jgi:hypothetical protein